VPYASVIVTLTSLSPCLTAFTTSWPLGYVAEDGVLGIEVRGFDVSDEELAAVGAGSGVGHGERANLVHIGLALDLVVKAVARAAGAGALRAAAWIMKSPMTRWKVVLS